VEAELMLEPRRWRYLCLVVVVLIAAACGDDTDTGHQHLAESSWEATAVAADGTLVGVDPSTITTVVFDNGLVSGSDGCNRYRFTVKVDGDRIVFDELSITGASCEPGHAGQGERFITAMRTATRYTATGDQLRLYDTTDRVVAEFRPAAPLPLRGVAWWVTGFAADGGGLSSPLTQISLSFRSDGTLVGVSGCNDYFAAFTTDSSTIAVEDLAFTERACAEPPGVMAEEAAYFAAVQQVTNYVTSLETLTLYDGEQSVVAEYRFGGRIR
jgi:heat shock protein HslJ